MSKTSNVTESLTNEATFVLIAAGAVMLLIGAIIVGIFAFQHIREVRKVIRDSREYRRRRGIGDDMTAAKHRPPK